MICEYPTGGRVFKKIMTQERRLTTALALLLGWYVVFGIAGYVLWRVARPDPGLPLAIGPIAAVTAAIVAPTTVALLAQSRRDLSPLSLATLGAAAGLAFLVLGSLVALALLG